jgi:hypothetical protein
LPGTNFPCFFLLFFGFGFLWAVLIINHRLSNLENPFVFLVFFCSEWGCAFFGGSSTASLELFGGEGGAWSTVTPFPFIFLVGGRGCCFESAVPGATVVAWLAGRLELFGGLGSGLSGAGSTLSGASVEATWASWGFCTPVPPGFDFDFGCR